MSDWPRRVSAAFDAYNADGPDGFIEHLERGDALHPDFLAHVQDDLPNGGDWRGVEGFNEMASTWLDAWDTFTVSPHEFDEVREGVVLVPLTQTAAARGMEVAAEFFYLFLIRDDKLAQVHIYADRDRAERAGAEWS